RARMPLRAASADLPWCLPRVRAQKRPPAGIGPPRCGIDTGAVQDPPDGGDPDRVALPDQFALDPAVAPGRVLPCEAQDQLADLQADRLPSGRRPRVGPFSCEEVTVPAQHGG